MTPEHKKLFNKLTRLQKGVCLGVLDGISQRQAYFAAGGLAKNDESADSITARMLADAKVKAFMDAVDEEAISDRIMTKTEAMEQLTLLAGGNVTDLVNFNTVELETSDGPAKQSVWALKDQDKLDEDKLAMISELSAGKDGFKFKTHSKTQAITQLSKMLGWEAPIKTATTDADGNDQPSLVEMGRAIVFALESAVDKKDTPNDNTTEGENNGR